MNPRGWELICSTNYLLNNILKDLDENDMVLLPRIVGGQSPEKGNHFILWVCVKKKKKIFAQQSVLCG